MKNYGANSLQAFEAAGFTADEIMRLDANPTRWEIFLAWVLRRDPVTSVDGIHWTDAKRAAFEYVVERRYEQAFGPDWRDHVPNEPRRN